MRSQYADRFHFVDDCGLDFVLLIDNKPERSADLGMKGMIDVDVLRRLLGFRCGWDCCPMHIHETDELRERDV